MRKTYKIIILIVAFLSVSFASELSILYTHSVVGDDVKFDLTVAMVPDGGGAVETDSTNSVTLSLAGGSGNLTSATGLTQNLVNGQYTWNDLKYDATNDFTIQASATGVTNVTSETISGTTLETTFPYTENYDSFSSGITAGKLTDNWTNSMYEDDGDWTVDADGTPSNNTGPSYDHTQGSSGSGNYLFTESSNNQNPGNPNQSAYLESPVFDVSSLDIPVLQFWYHLYGGNMGYLHVDIFENGDWNNDVITAFTDNEDNWQAKAVNLSEYSDSIKVRFRGITGSGWRSDIAIDDFTIKESEDTVIVHQATTDSVTAGTDNNQILRLDFINTSNSYLDTLIITSNNTIDSDIKSNGVKLYYTSDSTFSTDEQIGIGKSFSGGEARFEDLNYDLSLDTSYVWVCYDISGSATLSDTVDAIIGANDIVVNSNSWSNEQQNPPKSRPVRTGKILESITYNQSKYRYADQGATGIPVLRVDIEVTGTSGIFNLNSLEVTSNNTNDADIQTNGVKLFRTSGTTFSTASQLGTSQSFSSGVATFSSLNYALNTGTTYIWVCYDINSGATIDNIIDAKIGIDDIDINGDTYPSAEESPNESMLVKDFVTVSPHKEGFETDFGDFNQYDFDDGSWTRISGGTPSNNTGPDGAYGGSYYVYTEASSGSDPGNPDQTTIIDLPLDLSSITDNFFYFYYHMYGASMGSLHIDVFDGEWHNDLFTKNGQQQTSDTDDWLKANISLRDYSNKNHVILRIRGITGDDYTSDMAVDNFTIMEREDTVIVHQATTDSVTAGTYNNQILRLDFINNPNLQDNVLDTLIVTSNNTTDIDIKSNGVKLYYTSDSTFSANDQIGSGKSFSGGEARFENLSYDLSSDTSFVWVCYDISDTATFDNTVDAIIGAGDVIVSGNSLLDNSQNPPNNRPIRTSKIIKSITYNQSEYRYADQGATEIPVLRIDLEVIGTSGTLKLNSLEVTSNNTNDADIQTNGVNLFTTSDSTFSTTNQLGTSQSFSLGVATFSSLDDTLDIGTTYIWVSYDINSGATIDNIIDAKIGINGIDINGDTYPSAEESPDESMLVKDFVTVSPHEEGFETDFGDFNQYDFDDGNWTRDNNGTPSNNTGPNGAYEGSYYVYTEASSGADPGFPDQTTIIDLPLDLSSITDNFFYFYYHMYGADMGSLRIDIFDGKWHNDLFMKSGQQQSADTDAWIKANVSLIDYNNKDHVILRIRGITGDGYTSDMAVDSIVIRESTEPPDVAINPSPADDSTRINVRTDLSWDKNSTGGGVSGFKLSLWYVDGGNHYICQNKDLGGNVFTYDPSTDGYDTLRYNETYYWTVTPYNANGSATGVSTWSFTTIDLVRILDYSESFEIGFNKWIQLSSDDGNWTRNSGGTPSGSTGPSGAHDGSYYLYTEASNGADPGFPNKT
ncbi:MAG: hypothetical protein U9N76_06805, partial [Candidatus Marinimicrobia bacterium]|nr:hypothetical protein [Candidatus Neomarinimicrobiota bacterium]